MVTCLGWLASVEFNMDCLYSNVVYIYSDCAILGR